MSRYREPREVEVSAGCRAGRCEAAGARRQQWPSGWTPPPRDREGTHPGRISLVRNVETPSRSRHRSVSGGPTVREAELLAGNRMIQEANAGGSKGHGNPEQLVAGAFAGRSGVTGRIPGLMPRAREGADVDQVSPL